MIHSIFMPGAVAACAVQFPVQCTLHWQFLVPGARIPIESSRNVSIIWISGSLLTAVQPRVLVFSPHFYASFFNSNSCGRRRKNWIMFLFYVSKYLLLKIILLLLVVPILVCSSVLVGRWGVAPCLARLAPLCGVQQYGRPLYRMLRNSFSPPLTSD